MWVGAAEWGRGGMKAQTEGVKRLSQWKLTTWGELRESCRGLGGGRSVESVSVYLKRGTLPMREFVEDVQKNEVSKQQRARRGVPSLAPWPRPRSTTPLPPPSAPGISKRRRGPAGRGREAVGSKRQAHCGPRSPPQGTICSLSMHHLLVWAVTGATRGGGGLRSVCVSSLHSGCSGAGATESPKTSLPSGGGQRPPSQAPPPPSQAPPLAAALRALQRHPSCLHSRR